MDDMYTLMAIPFTFVLIFSMIGIYNGLVPYTVSPDTYHGYIDRVEYAQGGWGSSSITTVYFTNRTFIFYGTIEINEHVNATILYKDRVFRGIDYGSGSSFKLTFR